MKLTPKTWRGVFGAACLTTLACTMMTEVMVYLFFHGQDMMAALKIAPLISVVTGFPFSFFIWSQVKHSIKLSEELQRLVDRDRLTDVATRDFFFARMRSNPHAYGTSLMVDIDLFKTVNDTFGHMAGDAVISRVAGILRSNTRANDVVCRFGGEEFVIFLHEQGTADGFDVAERMRKAIAKDVFRFDGQRLSVTVSIGGSLKERLADVDSAIQQADQALYRAKLSGRNRTIFATQATNDDELATA